MIASILVPLLCGLGLFLFGMKVMELALELWTGPRLKRIMEKFTDTPIRGMLTGTALTALLQSSSVITVITVGMVNASILTFGRTLGIVLGTNIGTCLTTELISLNINQWALPGLLGGFAIWISTWLFPVHYLWRRAGMERRRARQRAIRYCSLAVCGFSCILLGMNVMQSIVPELQNEGLFTWFISLSERSLLWGIVAGILLTAIIQSSAAAIAMAMGLASVQAISVELGIAITLGANVGTCITALVASLGGTRAGYLVAWSHAALNAGGTLLCLPLLPALEAASAWVSDSPSSQIAHAQTIFNIVCSMVALPLCYLPFWHRQTRHAADDSPS